MPGKDVVKFPSQRDILEIKLEPQGDLKLEPGGDPDKYFTDERLTFTLHIENISDKKVQADLIFLFKLNRRSQEFSVNEEVEPGDTLNEEFTTELLALQDSGYISVVSNCGVNEQEDKIEIDTTGGNMPPNHPLYTFTVWDREFYRSDYVWPRRAQYISALLSLLIVTVGVMQLLLTA